eukprot:425013_1
MAEDNILRLKELLGNEFIQRNYNDDSIVERDFTHISKALPGLIGLYFSADWSPPGRQFTNILKECHTQWQLGGQRIEIIFCTLDQDQQSFRSGFKKHSDYLAFKFEERDDRIKALQNKYEVKGIPWLTIIGEKGQLIQNQADVLLSKKGKKAITIWRQQKNNQN